MSLKPGVVNFDETWAKILKTLKAVVTLEKIERAVWNDRFSDVYALCVAYPEPLGEKLYSEIKLFLEEHVKSLYQAVSSPDIDILREYHSHWAKYSQGSSYMDLLFRYLNSHLKKQKQDYVEISPYTVTPICPDAIDIGPLALSIWKSIMIEPLKETLVQHLLAEIRKDRNGEGTQQNVVHDTIKSFVGVQEYQSKGALSLYESEFEKPLLQETGEYYRREAADLLAENPCSVYIQKVDVRIQDEDLRARKFLHPVSYSRVIRECEARMVEEHIPYLQAECRQMVRGEKCADLSRMYKLLKHIPRGLHVMVTELEQHVEETGLGKIKSVNIESGPFQYVDAMLDVHSKFTKLIDETFHADQAFHASLDKACTTIVNYRHDARKPSKSPELLAKYCDLILKKSNKNLSDSELDEKLGEVIIVFKYIDDKDIFQKFYSKMLAKRLIHNLSISMDAEEAMISRLKHACGYEYTNRLHRMFTDMSISSDLNSSFSDFLATAQVNMGINFSLLVLQSGAWPLGQTSVSPFSIPQELIRPVQMFEQFYNGKFNGRKLAWLQHLSNGEVKLNYCKRTYFLTVSTFQMAVMLLFNDKLQFTFSELSTLTQLLNKELTRIIQSLVDVKLLNKTEDDDSKEATYSLNMNFSSKRTKLKITSAVQRDSPQESQESEQTMSSVDEDRKMYLQAAIVRIMKSRKVLKHNSLIQEVISQSRARFIPSVPMIKKCIEALIDKQYLDRQEGSKDEYSYVA
ncbi:cullin-2 [Nematostella vectensis]|uniref:cullin-2 n=1 Tax=Nematostella vectensis TaxID=45351 RepID=UPI00207792F2|nr:cullin-2 [Nematostella vectensis]